jgi:hypothetical protein
MNHSIQINRYLPIAVIYFFFNGFLLPLGLTYTTLLTPVFLIWLYRYPSFNYLWLFFLVSIPFAVVHFINGVSILAYLKSYFLWFAVYVFSLSFYQFIRNCNSLPGLFKDLTIINFFLVLFALVGFFIPVIREAVWYNNAITNGVKNLYRLKMFTYEASYYSFLMAPLAIYYYLKILFFRRPNRGLLFWMVTIPLLLSLSFGVLTALIMAMIFLVCSDLRILSLHPKLPRNLLFILLGLMALLFLALQFFPNNVIFVRIENVFKGHDSSFSGRTFDSIYLGWKLAAKKSILFGAGAGQIKVIGVELFNTFYLNTYTPDQLAIPNNIGDTLAQCGLLGVMMKLGLELYFFFKSKVYNNYYRLALFLFIFIYQFTGSFITNTAEYMIWIMAFYTPLFPEFNKLSIFTRADKLEPDLVLPKPANA